MRLRREERDTFLSPLSSSLGRGHSAEIVDFLSLAVSATGGRIDKLF
jgi:hypothetical protein